MSSNYRWSLDIKWVFKTTGGSVVICISHVIIFLNVKHMFYHILYINNILSLFEHIRYPSRRYIPTKITASTDIRVPVKCETKSKQNKTKRNKSKQNSPKRNRNETK